MKYLVFFTWMLLFCRPIKSMDLVKSSGDLSGVIEDHTILEGVCDGFINKPISLSRFHGMQSSLYFRYQYAFLKCEVRPIERQIEVVECIKSLAASGHAEALCNLGYYYEYVCDPVQLDEAERYYKEAAEKGLARAHYLLADFYSRDSRYGQSVAEPYMEKAAQLGYEPAQIRLAYWYFLHAKLSESGEFDNEMTGKLIESKEYYYKAMSARGAFFAKNQHALRGINDFHVIQQILNGECLTKQELLKCSYVYEEAAYHSPYTYALIKAGLVSKDPHDDIYIRCLLGAIYDNNPSAQLNWGLLRYQWWQESHLIRHYSAVVQLFKNALDYPVAAYELGLVYLNYEKDLAKNPRVVDDLKEGPAYEEIASLFGLIGSSHEGSIFKEVGRQHLMRALTTGHLGAKKVCQEHGFDSCNVIDLLRSYKQNESIKAEGLVIISPVVTRAIAQNCVLPLSLFIWLKEKSDLGIKDLNSEKKENKKDKKRIKELSKSIKKFEEFKTQCDQWIKEIQVRKKMQEKQQRDAQKSEKEEQKKLRKLQEKQQQAVSSESVKSEPMPADSKENVTSSETVEKSVFDSPQISNHARREEQQEAIPVKKKKIKTRPAEPYKPIANDRPQENKPTAYARPPLIRQMSAVALVRKNSKTDLNDPKYKRLVKRLSCSDLIGKLKVDETDIRRTLEELARRNLIDYRDEKTTITATKKNDHTVPLVIHTHGDWAANRDIVKQFLEFVYEVDSEYWQTSD